MVLSRWRESEPVVRSCIEVDDLLARLAPKASADARPLGLGIWDLGFGIFWYTPLPSFLHLHGRNCLDAAERKLPHNLEAERSVLGAILVHNDAFNPAVQVIDCRDFYREAHRSIFEQMVALSERKQAIDFVTLKEELSRGGDLDDIGGPAYIASLVDGIPARPISSPTRGSSRKGDTAEADLRGNKILTNAYEADRSPELILDEAESAIFAVADDRMKAGFVPIRELVKRTSRRSSSCSSTSGW